MFVGTPTTPQPKDMKSLTDEDGQTWLAGVVEEQGLDYKGRFFLTLRPDGGGDLDRVHLSDVRWNSRASAARTLDAMSPVELRRRLRSARGRSGENPPSVPRIGP